METTKPRAAIPDVSISLAAIEANQVVRIERLMLGSLEQLCEELGLHEGDVVQCRASSPRRLYLATANARTVAIDRDQARFVRVVPRAQMQVRQTPSTNQSIPDTARALP